MKKLLLVSLFTLSLFALSYSTSFAIPELQLYIEGATYDANLETWVTTQSSFKLWVVGDVGAYGHILDVRLAAAHPTGQTGSVSFSPTTTGVVTDPSTPGPITTPSWTGVDDQPLMSNGKKLPTHSIYGTGTGWEAYSLGEFNLTDSPIGDLINSFPLSFPNMGQINVYDVVVTGYDWVHFDAYNHVEGSTKAKFAPFSHDSGGTPVPEPGILILLGIAMGAIGAASWRIRKL